LRRYYELTDSRQVKRFYADLKLAIDRTRVDVVDRCIQYAGNSARGLSIYRMPSSGGSYARSHHKRTSHDPIGTLGTSVGEAYNDHKWAAAVEYGTRSHVIRSRGRYPLRITKKLPGDAGKETPYGVKYIDVDINDKYAVTHRGARAFYIYTEAFSRLVRKLPGFMRKVFKRYFVR